MKIKISNKIILYNPSKQIKDYIKGQFTLQNPKWIENRRMGRYNGKTPKFLKFYEVKNNSYSIPIGAEFIFPFLTHSNIRFEVYDQRYEDVVKFQFTGTLRDFQTEAALNVVKYNFATLQAPTGSGKTVMGLFTIAYRKQKTLVIVHTKDLMQQWVERAYSFLNIKPVEIGVIGDGSFKIGRRLTIGIINSLHKHKDKIKKEFGHVVTDECHRCPSSTFSEVLSYMNPLYRTSLSATAFRRDKMDQLIEWYGGIIRHIVPKDKLIEEGHILQPVFIIKETGFDCDSADTFSQLITNLCNDEKRNELIAEDVMLACKEKTNKVLILSERKEHCYLLQDILKALWNIDALCLTGNTKNRTVILNQLERKQVLIATSQLIGEGFDCPELNILFMTTPVRYAGRIIQYIGRIMRPGKNKKTPIVYDYADWNIAPLARQIRERIKIYGKENVRYE